MSTPIIPAAALAQHVAIVGKTGSGKTSTAKLAIEQVVAEGSRVCVLDPIKSDWWGVISSRDGKRPGLPFHVLGGPRAHVPLHSGAGAAIAELVARGDLPLSILDMADFEPGGHQRFFVAFAETLLKRMRGVLYLVLEEAHEFAPKERSGFEKENLAIHYAKKLATAGRSKGIRLIVATQRTQSLHNALLGSCDTLIAHRLTAPADQEPIRKWLKGNVEKGLSEQVANELASLKTGTGWLCSGEAKVFERIQFPRISTFDNSATPTEDAEELQVRGSDVDVGALRALIGTAVAEAEAKDPVKLQKRIKELEADLRAAAPAPAGPTEEEIQARIREAEDRIQDAMEAVTQLRVAEAVAALRADARAPLEQLQHVLLNGWTPPAPAAAAPAPARRFTPPVIVPPAARPAPRAPRPPRPAAEGELSGPERKILGALAWLETIGVKPADAVAVAFIAGYSPTSSSYANPRGSLRTKGLIDYPTAGSIALTNEGRAVAGAPDAPRQKAELHRMVMAKLDGPQQRILRPLLESYPDPMSVEDLAAAAGYSLTSSSFANPRGSLRTLGLIDYPQQGYVVACDILFPRGLR